MNLCILCRQPIGWHNVAAIAVCNREWLRRKHISVSVRRVMAQR